MSNKIADISYPWSIALRGSSGWLSTFPAAETNLPENDHLATDRFGEPLELSVPYYYLITPVP